MTTIGEIYDYIDSFAPFSAAMGFDNAGLLAGAREQPVERVLIALDITSSVIGQAVDLKAGLIISHHPVIFQPLRRLDPKMPAVLLARNGIGAICAHTNLDMAPFGVNICLGECLGLVNVQGKGILPETGFPSFFIGELPEQMEPQAFARLVKDRLQAGCVKYTEGNEPVRLIGFCSGAGSDSMEEAFMLGAQAFLTGEVKHHQWLLAAEEGKTLVEAGHYSTEAPVLEPLCRKLEKIFPQVEFIRADREQDPALYLE